jgi:pimeloyl-ACP methyl ester carboxylesterase
VRVEEHTIELAGAPVFYRSAPSGHAAIPVYLHGAPTSCDDWTGALERTGGLAPDLMGFGRSMKGGHLEYSPESLADFVEDVLTELSVDRFQLVTHGWGTTAGALLAARHPDRVQRLALFNSVPLLPDLKWPWWARAYRLRAVGELAMGFTTRAVLTRWLRAGTVNEGVWPPSRIKHVWEQFDQGTQRAVIRLQRSVDAERRDVMAGTLKALSMPVMMVWGERDPWCDATVRAAYEANLQNPRIERVPQAGHWPWLDDPTVIDRVAEFLELPRDH